MRLVLFDLDNTLLAGDSDVEWPRFLIAKGVLDRAQYEAANERFYQDYRAGTLDIYAFLDFQLSPLARFEAGQLTVWHREFMAQHILPIITPQARALVESHRLQSDLLAIITATNSFVTRPIAEEFGIAHLIATEPEQKAGEFTGKLSGIPCFRENKVKRLEDWLEAQSLTWEQFSETWFYSDSFNDLPLLQKVQHPVAVDPDPVLLEYATSHQWPVMSLRGNAV